MGVDCEAMEAEGGGRDVCVEVTLTCTLAGALAVTWSKVATSASPYLTLVLVWRYVSS